MWIGIHKVINMDPDTAHARFLLFQSQTFLAAKCSSINHLEERGSNRGREVVTEGECLKPLAFLPSTQKIFRQPIPENL